MPQTSARLSSLVIILFSLTRLIAMNDKPLRHSHYWIIYSFTLATTLENAIATSCRFSNKYVTENMQINMGNSSHWYYHHRSCYDTTICVFILARWALTKILINQFIFVIHLYKETFFCYSLNKRWCDGSIRSTRTINKKY